jgi:hypothetical protein
VRRLSNEALSLHVPAGVIGDDALDKIKARAGETVDLFELAAAGSIVAAGIKPAIEDGYNGCLRRPLPSCVWLTADRDMSADFCHTNGKWRVEVEVERCDSRLRQWGDYINENCDFPFMFECFGPRFKQAKEEFFVYFGTIHPRRIKDVEVVCS